MLTSRILGPTLARFAAAAFLAAAAAPGFASPATSHFSMAQVLGYPFPTELTSASSTDEIAWVLNEHGERDIWVASGPAFVARKITHYRGDSGQALTDVELSPDGKYLVYVRGGDPDHIYPLKTPPNPSAAVQPAKRLIWSVATVGSNPVLIGTGKAPAMAPDNRHVAFIHDGAVWVAKLDGSGKPHPLFADQGSDSSLRWSPNGKQLAFVSHRGDHNFIGVYTRGDKQLRFIAPSTHRDSSPRWSPDGTRIAFVRRPGRGGGPEPILRRTPHPWSIQVAKVATGHARLVWRSPHTLEGSMPDTAGGANLHWAADKRLVFVSDVDGWPHLYSISASGGKPLRLTTGNFMVDDVAMSPDRRFVIYNANTGNRPHDIDRRHLFKVPVAGGKPRVLTTGTKLEWAPTPIPKSSELAFIRADTRTPPLVAVMPRDGGHAKLLDPDQIPVDFPVHALVVPEFVTFKAPDGHTVYAQLFERSGQNKHQPAVVFVHGGPMRQMLLGWNYMGYYANAYAVNQYLVNHGFVVLSVNYRFGIGHGWTFHHPAHAGPAGASEYQDVLAGAAYLQKLPNVDGSRIGIWGGSYGGYLTALALARNSDIFKAGVDWAGIHDWALDMYRNWFRSHYPPFENGDRAQALKVAWQSSPVASMARWHSPVLLVQGDDDHTVRFHQTVDLARRLKAHHVPFRELVIPDEIHSFLRYRSWYRADSRTAEFLIRHLGKSATP